MRLYVLLSLIALLAPPAPAGAAPAAASDPLYDELEGADLAAALLRDGKHAAARAALEGLAASERRRRAALVALLEGELALASGNPSEAVPRFEAGLAAEGAAPLRGELELALARAHERSGRPKDCAAAATRAADLAYRTETEALRKASCERAAGDAVAAWGTLDRAIGTGLGFGARIEKARLMLSLGLREEASLQAQEHIAGRATVSEALALAEALLEAGAKEEALLALETARLRFPHDQEVLLAVAPLYYARGLKRATADAFALASVHDPSYAEHAAETLRQAGGRQRSRYLNIYIPGERERGRQKLALAVEGSRWDLVSSMDSLVRRTKLDDDDEVSYALAFSLLRGGDLGRSRSYLERVKGAGLLAKVSALFKSLEDCGVKAWRCL